MHSPWTWEIDQQRPGGGWVGPGKMGIKGDKWETSVIKLTIKYT